MFIYCVNWKTVHLDVDAVIKQNFGLHYVVKRFKSTVAKPLIPGCDWLTAVKYH